MGEVKLRETQTINLLLAVEQAHDDKVTQNVGCQ
jgi:hypothetical protein